MEWEFDSGVSKGDLEGICGDIYRGFRIDNPRLQALYEKTGKEAVTGELSELADLPRSYKTYKNNLGKEGYRFYWRVFLEGDPELAKAMKKIESCRNPKPLLIVVRSSDIYAPWQILYPDESTHENPAPESSGISLCLGLPH